MDPADAVRYAIPSLPFVALLAGVTLISGTPLLRLRHLLPASREKGDSLAFSPPHREKVREARMWGAIAILATLVYAIGSLWYAWPILHARSTMPSAPVAATRWIAQNISRDAIILFDLSLRPHAEYLLPDWKSMRIDEGSGAEGGIDPATPIVLLADGDHDDAITFRWPDTDAYRKLTRKHYGAVSVVPLPASRRLRVIEGVYPPERTKDGHAWRWIGARGVIELPNLGATRARISLRTPPEYPFEAIRVRIQSGGYDAITTVPRDATVPVAVPIWPGPARITITPERTFVPARMPGANNRDQRTLSVMLTRVEQLR
jgi:hypothetical protein